ncbi:hypothetical protein CLAFUR4_14413 [Fulvia fulva]|nr:hypothetical protein CLAFUR4_14413 [Fulvia fulva]WPV37679.1 hypothetical protein CLAFUW7_14422 [Fulvia fulva]
MNDSSLEIPLPEDDANALIILLNVLHYRNDQVPDALCTHDLVDVVNLADKYLCKDRIQLAARLWVRNMEAVTDALKLARSLTVCRQMEFDGKFSTICRRMLLYSTGEAKLDSDECQYGNLEENFKLAFEMLQSDKEYRFYKIDQFIKTTIKTFIWARRSHPNNTCDSTCHVAELATYELFDLLRTKHLEPDFLSCFELYIVLDAMKTMPQFPFLHRYQPCSSGCIYDELEKKMAAGTFAAKAEELTAPTKPLCLAGYRVHGDVWGGCCGLKGGVARCRHCDPTLWGCGCCGVCVHAARQGYSREGERLAEEDVEENVEWTEAARARCEDR